MRKEKGVWVLSSKEIAEEKFEGIVITLSLKKEENVLMAKKGYYNSHGNYDTELITLIAFGEGAFDIAKKGYYNSHENYDTKLITLIAFEEGAFDIAKILKKLLVIISQVYPKESIAVAADVMELLN